jgi:PAS domain S-box-containing protein
MTHDHSMTPRRLDDPARLAALRATGLLDQAPGPAFERIARLARDLLAVPVAAVSLVDDRRERVIGQAGLEAPSGAPLEVPVADSHGARLLLEGGELLVEDLRESPSLGALPGLASPGAVALAAVPIATPDGHQPGVVCVIDRRPRAWSERDLATLRDLAELAATELELRAAKRAGHDDAAVPADVVMDRYRLLSVEGRDIMLFVRAADGRIVGANQAAVDAYGYDRETLLGLSISDLRTPETQHTMQDDLERAASAGALLESVHRRRDGTTFPVESSARGADVGGERLVLAIIRDVSERKAAEHERAELLVRAQLARAEAEQANRLKDEFLSTLSHELRTPLNAILGWTRMLQSGQLAETRRAHALATIERNAHVQARLVDDILDVSRIVSGKLPLEITALDPCAIVGAAVDSVRPATEAKGLQLQVSCERDLGTVYADPGRLQQVVWNLLSNAVKFTPRGGRVEVRLRRLDEQLEIEVSDTGQGIGTEFLPHVFERFRQADAGSARQHGGLGLGLAIVRHLVELHGGSVSVQSEGVGRGATFIARFPLVAAEPEASAAPEPGSPAVHPDRSAPIEREPSLEGVHVLVVDDELDARELLRSLLQSCGARVSTAASADEAARTLRDARPDLLVSDIGMPGQDGIELIARVRASGPASGGSIPAVALTAFARPEDRARALSAGFSAYLTKPVDLSLLLRTLARLLRRSLDP